MSQATFKHHLVICGWNKRGKPLVEAVQRLGDRPIVILHSCVDAVIRDVEHCRQVYVMAGDCTKRDTLLAADVGHAHSVIVLAIEELGSSADARSVQIALAVERIHASVNTIIELRDIQNKAHFSWTKVDELVTDQELAVRMIAQAVRHVMLPPGPGVEEVGYYQRSLLAIYRQLIDPAESRSQLLRINLPWASASALTFEQILSCAIPYQVLPTAVVGFKKHDIPPRPGESTVWTSWKSDPRSNPPAQLKLKELWPIWPGDDFPFGILALAKSLSHANRVRDALLQPPQVP